MRELKIRAWHKPYKQMCNVSMLQFDYDRTICAAVIIEKPFNDQRLVKIDDLIIEQFTGLKDKNGTEIYEGDIIVQKSLGSNKSGCRGKITYKEDHAAFMFEVYERGKPVMWLFLSEFNPEKTCEVIGNIHENSELVEEE